MSERVFVDVDQVWQARLGIKVTQAAGRRRLFHSGKKENVSILFDVGTRERGMGFKTTDKTRFRLRIVDVRQPKRVSNGSTIYLFFTV